MTQATLTDPLESPQTTAAGRPLSVRATIWLGTAAVIWTVVFAGRAVMALFDSADALEDPQAQQLTCSADQMDADGRCL